VLCSSGWGESAEADTDHQTYSTLTTTPLSQTPSVTTTQHQTKRAADTAAARAAGLPPAAADAALSAARAALHAVRAARPRPSLDNKIVTAWNGAAIGAFARASRALQWVERGTGPTARFPVEGGEAGEYLGAAVRAARFVKERLWDVEGGGVLRRSYCSAPGAVQGALCVCVCVWSGGFLGVWVCVFVCGRGVVVGVVASGGGA